MIFCNNLSIHQIIFYIFYNGIICSITGLLFKQAACLNALKEFKEAKFPWTIPRNNRMTNLDEILIETQSSEHHRFCSASLSFNSLLIFIRAGLTGQYLDVSFKNSLVWLFCPLICIIYLTLTLNFLWTYLMKNHIIYVNYKLSKNLQRRRLQVFINLAIITLITSSILHVSHGQSMDFRYALYDCSNYLLPVQSV